MSGPDAWRLLLGVLGLVVCAWNLWSCVRDARAVPMPHPEERRRSEIRRRKAETIVARGAVLRTVLYTLAQLAIVVALSLARVGADVLFGAQAYASAMSALVLMMSVHERLTRVQVHRALND